MILAGSRNLRSLHRSLSANVVILKSDAIFARQSANGERMMDTLGIVIRIANQEKRIYKQKNVSIPSTLQSDSTLDNLNITFRDAKPKKSQNRHFMFTAKQDGEIRGQDGKS